MSFFEFLMRRKSTFAVDYKLIVEDIMKYGLFSLMVWVSALCAGFTACSDDDDRAQAIAGTYKGKIVMAGVPIVNEAQIVITRDGNRLVTLKMQETVLGIDVNIACQSVVLYKNQQYAVSGGTTFNMAMGEAGASVPVPVTVDGTIDQGGETSIDITVEIPGAPVTVVFEGQKQ
jgi:uncharacterized spore protein YtfJ